MQVVTLGKGMGKTARAIKECLETGATMLVDSEYKKQRLKNENPDLKIASVYDVTGGSFLGRDYPKFVMDNSEQVVLQLIKTKPELVELLVRQFVFGADVNSSYWEG